MLKELKKPKATAADLQKKLNAVIRNQNAILTKLRGGGMTDAEAEAIQAALHEEQE